MSENPFQAPHQIDPYGHTPMNLQGVGRGYIQQVPVIASLMIVQGVLLLMFSLLMLAYSFFAPQFFAFMPPEQQAEFQGQMQQQTMILTIVFGVASALTFSLAVMHFMAAYYGFTFKYRLFGIITMIMGLGAMATCYCAPTAIGLAVYGMIIYFNPAVSQAFAMAKSGMKRDQILEQFPR